MTGRCVWGRFTVGSPSFRLVASSSRLMPAVVAMKKWVRYPAGERFPRLVPADFGPRETPRDGRNSPIRLGFVDPQGYRPPAGVDALPNERTDPSVV